MATYDEIESILNKYGPEPPPLPKKQKEPDTPSVGPPSAQAAPAEPEADSDEPGFISKVASSLPGVQFGKGMARGAARLGTSAAKLAGNIPGAADLPGKLPDVAQRALGAVQEFGEQPSGGLTEGAGAVAGEFGPLMAIPGVGIEAAATRAALMGLLPRMLTSSRVPMFIRGMGFGPSLGKTATTIARAGDQAAKGAAGGAIANPDDPLTGAEVGAAAGPVLGAAGAAMRTPVGRWMGGHIPASLASHATWAAGKALGIPGPIVYPAAHSVRWYSAPIGRQIIQRGRWLTDQTGRVIGEIIAPGTAAPAGAAVSEASQ